jgi:PEP-CTERM motif
MSLSHRLTQLAAAAAVLLSAGLAQASALYATSFGGATSQLYTVDPTTGAVALVGTVDAQVGDLTSLGGSTLMGVDLGSRNALVTIDPLTGGLLSTVGITGARGAITSIAADPTTGKLYGNTTTGFGGDDQLYLIDPTSGVATLLGAIGFRDVYALGFTQGGELLGISNSTEQLLSLSVLSGLGTAIGATGSNLQYDIASRPEDDLLFGLSSLDMGLKTYDTTTGAASAVGPYGVSVNLAGLAFLGSATVPEPSTLAILGLGLAGLGVTRRRR